MQAWLCHWAYLTLLSLMADRVPATQLVWSLSQFTSSLYVSEVASDWTNKSVGAVAIAKCCA